ncbi:hypothetical protein [Xenorhabdus sp. PB30.3]|uniref:hypothetical protein n=1 Tax=Xenorhabdus sp. PB30.3 TaxID=2788941 RepID=UPI0040407108
MPGDTYYLSALFNQPDNQLPPFNGDIHRLPGGKSGFFQPSYSSQKASILNQEAQTLIKEILSNPNTKIESRVVFENKQRIIVVEATAPDGRALRFNADGTRLIGFREPPNK